MSASKPKKSKWLDSWNDPLARAKCFSSCLRLVDLNGDGDHRMVVGNMDKKLKVFKGMALASEHVLLDKPASVCAFYTDENSRGSPALAVAAGPFVFVYRNLRPYFKYTVPQVEIDPVERDIWDNLESMACDAPTAAELLITARDNGTALSSRSLDFLALEDPSEQAAFVLSVKDTPMKQDTVITCMETLKKVSTEPDAVSSLVIGTESKRVLILDPAATSMQCSVELGGVPVFMAVTGEFDTEWRIVVACRDGKLYTVTNGQVRGTAVVKKPQIELEAQPCGLVRRDKQIYVATMDSQLHCYSIKGQKLFSIRMPAHITNLELLEIRRSRLFSAVIVALTNGEVRIYNERVLADTIMVNEVVTAVRFGRYSREDNTLVIITRSGALKIKMLQRSADLDEKPASQGPLKEQDIPLPVPKKTQLYIDQTQREREQCTEMHRIFQNDLCKLRLHTSRSYVKLITDGQLGVAPVGGANIRLNVQVWGLGPLFKLKVDVQNGGTRALSCVPLAVTYDHEVYRMKCSHMVLPVLLPGLLNEYTLDIKCIEETAPAGTVRTDRKSVV